jgi:hypothetical protein
MIMDLVLYSFNPALEYYRDVNETLHEQHDETETRPIEMLMPRDETETFCRKRLETETFETDTTSLSNTKFNAIYMLSCINCLIVLKLS